MFQFLATLLNSVSHSEQHEAARRWGEYEEGIMQAMLGQEWVIPPFDENWLPKYRLQAHYLSHGCFISERLLFRCASRIANVHTIVLHGTHDWICPPENARRLIRFLPNAEMRWVAKGTHTCADVAMAAEMRQAILDMQK